MHQMPWQLKNVYRHHLVDHCKFSKMVNAKLAHHIKELKIMVLIVDLIHAMLTKDFLPMEHAKHAQPTQFCPLIDIHAAQ
jgi:hypothetical protein